MKCSILAEIAVLCMRVTKTLQHSCVCVRRHIDGTVGELHSSQQQHIMQLYCSNNLNNAFRFFWKAMGPAYAKPPSSLLAKVLTKIAHEGGRVVMCTPDWGCSGEHAYWRHMLDPMTARKQFHLDLIQVYLKGRQSIFKNVTGQLVVSSTIVSLGCVAQPRLFSS